MPKAKKKSGSYTRPEPGISTRSHRKRPTTEPTPPVTDSIRPSTSKEAAGANNDHLATTYGTNNVNGPSTSLQETGNVHGLHGRTVLDPKTGVVNRDTLSIDSGVKNTFSKKEVTNLISKAKDDILSDRRTAGNINDSQPKVTSLTAAQDTMLSQPASFDWKTTDPNQGLHNQLANELAGRITADQLTKLVHSFRLAPFGDGKLETLDRFLKLWIELDTSNIIGIGNYDELSNKLESIKAACHIDVIKEFEEKMLYAGQTITGRQIHDMTLTKAKLLELTEEFRPLMEKQGHFMGTEHVYENAVFGLIPRKGGELRLKNGTVKLQVPPNEITGKYQGMFWIFRPLADDESNLAACDQTGQRFDNSSDIVKYSLPVFLGPPDVAFQSPALLTLKEYSFLDSCTLAQLLVYRKTDENGTWEIAGSCFRDKSSRTARVNLNRFSSYVVGMPAASELLPLNVHIMVQRLPKEKDDISPSCDIQVVFSMNDHSYIQEMVLRKRMNIVCETSYYMDPKSDVNIIWERRNADDSVHLKQTAVLEKGRLNSLAEKVQTVTIPIQDNSCLDEESKDLVILFQNDTQLVELFCHDDRHMVNKQKEKDEKSKSQKLSESNNPELEECLSDSGSRSPWLREVQMAVGALGNNEVCQKETSGGDASEDRDGKSMISAEELTDDITNRGEKPTGAEVDEKIREADIEEDNRTMPKAKKMLGPYARPEPGPLTRSRRKRPTAEPTPPVTDNICPSTSLGNVNNNQLKETSSTAAQDTGLSPLASLDSHYGFLREAYHKFKRGYGLLKEGKVMTDLIDYYDWRNKYEETMLWLGIDEKEIKRTMQDIEKYIKDNIKKRSQPLQSKDRQRKKSAPGRMNDNPESTSNKRKKLTKQTLSLPETEEVSSTSARKPHSVDLGDQDLDLAVKRRHMDDKTDTVNETLFPTAESRRAIQMARKQSVSDELHMKLLSLKENAIIVDDGPVVETFRAYPPVEEQAMDTCLTEDRSVEVFLEEKPSKWNFIPAFLKRRWFGRSGEKNSSVMSVDSLQVENESQDMLHGPNQDFHETKKMDTLKPQDNSDEDSVSTRYADSNLSSSGFKIHSSTAGSIVKTWRLKAKDTEIHQRKFQRSKVKQSS